MPKQIAAGYTDTQTLMIENARLQAELTLANQRIVALEARIERMKRQHGADHA